MRELELVRLLAKSCDDPRCPPDPATLPGHTQAVLESAQVLLTERGEASLRAVGLPLTLINRLERIVLVAALIHDLGKASRHFQAMVRHQQTGQLIRHEAVSAWIAWQEPLRSWLAGAFADPADLPLAIAAAAGHHRKFRDKAVDEGTGQGCAGAGLGTQMGICTDHADVAGVLRLGQRILQVGEPPCLPALVIRLPISRRARGLFMELERAVDERLQADPNHPVLLAVAKALVLDADVAGSALPRSGEGTDWMIRQLRQRAAGPELDELIATRLDKRPLRPFQQRVADCSAPVALVKAGCGCGKTLAAYAWFARQHVGRQLWITYPTTGTALEGFRDYLHGIDGLVSDLESGRRDVDLDLCELRERMDEDAAHRDADRIASLRAWGKHAIACTVDTVLGLVQNQRKGLYAWAGLAHGAVVFDEIHAYDDRLFGCLLHFLEHLPGIPALLMTASLPQGRLDDLDAFCRRRHGAPLTVIPGPADLEALPRYRLEVLPHDADPWPQVGDTLSRGGKVLWVSNTVDRCLALADAATARGLDALIYHSRFRYMDRVARHKAVVSGFGKPGPCFAVTSQVAEMSLDLSADLLVSDLAPVPALIQRLGRLNRRSTPEDPQPITTALILPVDRPLPYTQADLDEARTWLVALGDQPRGQTDLVMAWQPRRAESERIDCAWIDGGFDSEPREVRTASPGITVLRHEDVDAVQADARQAVALALPMSHPPKAHAWMQWRRLHHLPVAPAGSIIYDPQRGARWA